MTRQELHDHINELAEKVKYFNEGIRQSRFVEDAEVDLLENYVHALHREIASLRQEGKGDKTTATPSSSQHEQPSKEREKTSYPSRDEHGEVAHQTSDNQFVSQPETVPGHEQERLVDETPSPEDKRETKEESRGANDDASTQAFNDEPEETTQEVREETAKTTKQIPEEEADTSFDERGKAATTEAKDEADDSTTISPESKEAEASDQEEQQVEQREPEIEESRKPKEQSKEEKNAPQEQEEDGEDEQTPEYIKQLLANKEKRDQSWEDLEQEADEYGGQSYVQKIRELKRRAEINPEKPTLNERLKKDQPELSQRINRHVQDIREAIGVNDRYLFISELFNGNADAYKQTIEELNRLQSKKEAERYVKENLEPMKAWQDNPRIAEKMNELIVRRFDDDS